MGLVTSVAALDGRNLYGGRASQAEKAGYTGKDFQAVFQSMAQGVPESMDAIFEEAASRFGISVNLLKAVGKAESNFDPNAVSKAGAMGVMQLMPATAQSLGVTNPFDVRQNIMGGAQCLKGHLEQFGGDVSLALAAYNAGPGSVKKYGGIPPYKETQNYVKTVMSYFGGEPINTGKTVGTSLLSGAYGSNYNGLGGSYGNLLGAGGLYGATSGLSSGLYGSSSGIGSSLYGNPYNVLGGYSGLASADAMGMLLGAATADEDGETISMDKASFANLIQILRLQMMMNASREVGTITI
ncbi:MAG: lytic transglycosylase domain-containing protein [Lachnospiraceae bacterium]|nr:lytic transglycosylase domain-containing protein [Lachnospiraceae bacterium]